MDNSPSPAFLRPWSSVPRPLLIALAVLLCAATTLHALVWMYDQRHPAHVVEIGFNQSRVTFFDPATSSIPIYTVTPGSPAEHAGLQPNDQIVALNGHPLTSYALFDEIWLRSHPGDSVDVTVRRAGEPQALTFHPVFRASAPGMPAEGFARTSAKQILGFYPIFFVLVGFAVLFLRLDDGYAWLLALLFASFVGVAGFNYQQALPDSLRVFTSIFRSLSSSLIIALFYIFFAVFPEKSPLERRAPWLKWFALAIGASQLFRGFLRGDPRWPEFVGRVIGESTSDRIRLALTFGLVVLGFVSLLWNCYGSETSPEARRKSRVLLGGTLVGVLPVVLKGLLTAFFGYRAPFWVDTILSLLLLLYPLSFAYAIVKHRVLEIPVLLRRSARYVLVQRGFFLLLFCGALLAIFLFARFFSGFFAENSQFGMALSAAFGVAMVWVSSPLVRRGTDRIDRAFFRSSYDARVILQDLAERTRTVTDRRELAQLLVLHIAGALHPKSLACYLETENGDLAVEGGTVPRERGTIPFALPRPRFPFRFGARFVLQEADTIPATLPLLTELARNGKAWDVPPPVSDEAGDSAALTPECLVPIVGRNNRLLGLLVLGPRLSEEPYSGEDKGLLESVAGHAAVSLENMRLAEQMADRMERDRRAAHEMQIARDVQSRLFPQVTPPLATLEYVGSCIQAREVGGDYYDFLDLGSSQRLDRGATRPLPDAAWHLAFILADISGKGIAAALLMANLQANLRSRYASALDDLPRLLKSVNQLFYENTPDDRYATLFFAVYDDRSREFEYANCGHNAPLLFRANGSLERLVSTSTVIGLFPEWECVPRSITLAPGDLLVIYTDGVTEANDAQGNEFGEARLRETVRGNLHLSPADLLTAIQDAVQKFSAGEQFDDLTLVVARAR
ncbi:MAG: SpoIIE family protein phosphatase [Candidatus Acidiferrum sp.]